MTCLKKNKYKYFFLLIITFLYVNCKTYMGNERGYYSKSTCSKCETENIVNIHIYEARSSLPLSLASVEILNSGYDTLLLSDVNGELEFKTFYDNITLEVKYANYKKMVLKNIKLYNKCTDLKIYLGYKYQY